MESDSSRQQFIDILKTYQAEDILTPISMTKLISTEDSLEDILEIVAEQPHSTYPVYSDGIDDIVGILNISDLLLKKDTFQKITDILVQPIFISENTNLLEILEEFQKKKTYLALVVDEHGAIRGVVTQSDIINGIVEQPQSAEDLSKYIVQKDSRYYIDTRLTIEEFNKKFDTELECKDFDSIGGYVIEQFTYVPQVNETLTTDDFKIVVTKIEGAKLQEVSIEFLT